MSDEQTDDAPADEGSGGPAEHLPDDEARPEMSEVDNSDAELPTVQAWYDEHEGGSEDGEEVEGQAGSSDPSARFREMEISEEEQREIAEERERRLAPENRPDNTEVDNTGRTFEDGHFVD
ncbi:MAG TPA: hypothetical protein VL551_09250 [Actinospica sp.]|nr:hypothetical protein [Actinospica sp.]